MKKQIAVIVLMWNDWKNTRECLESLLKQVFKDITIVLVDNNSSNFFLKKLYNWKKNKSFLELKKPIKTQSRSKIIFIKNEKNLGCGFGHNTGFKFAILNNYKYTARIDNDMVVPSKLLKNLFDIMEQNPRIVGLSPKIMYNSNRNLISWRGAKIGNALKFQRHMRDYKYFEADIFSKERRLAETDSIAGCASIMKTKRLKKVGLSDPDFFYGPEDVELSYRLKEGPRSLMVSLNDRIFHKVTQSLKDLKKKRIYFEYKYRLVLILKIGSFFDKFFGYSTAIIKWFIFLILFLDPKQRKKITPVGLGLFDFFLNNLGKFDRDKGRFN